MSSTHSLNARFPSVGHEFNLTQTKKKFIEDSVAASEDAATEMLIKGGGEMDKAKINLIVIVVLVIACLGIGVYASGLSGQLNAEKTKSTQLNDQIKGLNSKVSDLQAQLSSAVANVNNQASSVSNLQSSLNAALAETASLKALKAELEVKLQSAISNAAANAQQAVTGAVSSMAPEK